MVRYKAEIQLEQKTERMETHSIFVIDGQGFYFFYTQTDHTRTRTAFGK